MTRVLVLNCGSSSVRYRLFDGADVQAKGLIQRIGEPGGDATDHLSALRDLMDRLDLSDLAAVGHRVVHGGERFTEATVITDEVVAAVEELVPLAPLHNPGALTGIRVARELLPEVPQVAVFDTAFHSTIPPEGVIWAVDRTLAERFGLRRYGFHGTSHAYVSRRTAHVLDRPVEDTRVITLHLGNGASAAAVDGGVCVATSMGMTPLSGLVMGTRSGDIDPSLIFHLHRAGGLSLDEIEDSLTRHGGLLGLTGANDMREVLDRVTAGDPEAELAFLTYTRRLREYVGAYLAVLGGAHAITFTAGVGENSSRVRAAALAGLEPLGIIVDEARNSRNDLIISPDGAPVTVCVIPTEEELEIADESRRALALPV
ncbi:acetate kinase [Actinoplanes sp. SE50]|uniref:acetate/propionate family kinase n=1 Tax=unclassified Actinoplanes TaxID=2626549 RepID=UPI00023EE065|nr:MULTISPECIES: acetate kinase [unclassified Actinoplanes]AEV88428.1 acetate kinase [Actinoplanes sp. SE50/110]ATO86833.1 acetate kinase [Actinoplanes sp. SE50]SLM04251.1 acetate kinase [Actinoplanes sp. SE50/110]